MDLDNHIIRLESWGFRSQTFVSQQEQTDVFYFSGADCGSIVKEA